MAHQVGHHQHTVDFQIKKQFSSGLSYQREKLIYIHKNIQLLRYENISSHFPKKNHPMNNLLLISSNEHSSNPLKNIHIHKNSPNICLPWPLKVKISFKFKNFRMAFATPSENIYQHKIPGCNTNLSQTMIINCLNFSSHQTNILSSTYQKKTINNYQ